MSAPQSNTPIAIIGMSMNFPESGTSATAFWDMLCKGRNVSTKIPKERFNVDAFRHPDTSKHYSMNADGGHFIETPLDCFDAPFFSIGLAEAACMDPQQRLLLETSFHALENAGITIPSCAGSETAVYTGSFMDDYKSVMYADPELERRYAASGLATNMIANRISWFYDFRGPSVNLDTACSSSLTALHACCQDLRLGIVNMGLVGGCSLVFGPDNFYTMTSMNFLSPDNRSHSFDESANGYSRGEGFGMVVVKRLDDAIRDGDTVRAIIRATGIGQDGRTPGITVPSGSSQRSLIEKTYSQAGISMEPTRYCEAHATGTPVGDPIEANAIGEAFAKYRTESAPMFLGSVKANVGHMEAASGLASLIKTVLILESGVIPPVAGLENINSKIKAQQYHLHVSWVS
uniref:Ketosynthase family 3 (KS3) domain-containing protein n=1 Tax=Ramularia collo-cygni TaxID=112498 RepID=A0A2D3USP9_9PEZI